MCVVLFIFNYISSSFEVNYYSALMMHNRKTDIEQVKPFICASALLPHKQKGNYCCCSTSLDMRSTQPFNLFTSSTMTKQLSTPKLPMLLGSVSAPFVGNGQV